MIFSNRLIYKFSIHFAPSASMDSRVANVVIVVVVVVVVFINEYMNMNYIVSFGN